MSDPAGVLRALTGEDEWARHLELERLRTEGASRDALRSFRDALDDDADATRRAAARMALAALADPRSPAREPAQALLREALRSQQADLRVLAASALGEAGDAGAAGDLIGALADPDPNAAAAAADALGALGHPAGLGPLADLATRGEFWLRAAAVVALGRIRDPRAVPALARAATEPGLEGPVVEALAAIDDPAALPVLEALHPRAGDDALLAAGRILCSHPQVPSPPWLAEAARAAEPRLRERLEAEEDPAAARLLGIAGTDSAVATLLDLVAAPRRSEAALTGMLAVPEERADAILARIPDAAPEERAALLSTLPPLRAGDRVARLVPLLGDPDPGVRAAAADALARAPAERALPLLSAELERRGPAPEVLRALGVLGGTACQALVPLLDDPAPDVRAAAAHALSRCAGPEVAGPIERALAGESDAGTRAALLRALGRAGGGGAVERITGALDDPDLEVRLAAIEALGATGSDAAVGPLRTALEREVPERLAALRALGDLGSEAAAPALRPHLRSGDPDTRRVAARAAAAVARAIPDEMVAALADDGDEWVRIWAARILARRGEGARPRLERMAESDPAPAVRAEARRVAQGEP